MRYTLHFQLAIPERSVARKKSIMIVKNNPSRRKRVASLQLKYCLMGLVATILLLYAFLFVGEPITETSVEEASIRQERWHRTGRPQMVRTNFKEDALEDEINKGHDQPIIPCPYQSMDDFTIDELHPKAGMRHMITPPEGGKLSHVCCVTTKGPLSFVIHHRWAPIGAARVLEMVTTGYFSFGQGIPLMRCVKGFLCQFGIHSDTSKRPEFNSHLEDDVNWLPEGPDHRTNVDGIKRFAKGYLAYAGGGKNSRTKQLIMSLESNGPLAGGSPWEVPWGEVVGDYSFATMDKIYTGYGEKGPPQGRLSKEGASPALREEFPKLDYIRKCMLVDERILDDDGNPIKTK